MADLQTEAARFGQNLQVGEKVAGLINKTVSTAGQVAEVFGVPGASMVGDALAGGSGGVTPPGISMPEIGAGSDSPQALQSGQFNQSGGSGGSPFPSAIDVSSKVSSGPAKAIGAETPALGSAVPAVAPAAEAASAAKAIPLIL